MLNRREFIACTAASTASLLAQSAYEWGGMVLDVHLHLRQDRESNLAHITGSGVTKAVLLTRVQAVDRARALAEKHPGRFVWFVSADVMKADNDALLTKAVTDGALGLVACL
jgi:hypothetical protein